jgi:hypothetical protein
MRYQRLANAKQPCFTNLPFQRAYAHDIQASDSIFDLVFVVFVSSPPTRIFFLSLVPIFIVGPDFLHRQAFGAILLVCQQEKRDA